MGYWRVSPGVWWTGGAREDRHTLTELLGQRIFGIACGHPDGNETTSPRPELLL